MKTFTKLLFTAALCASPAFMNAPVEADWFKRAWEDTKKTTRKAHQGYRKHVVKPSGDAIRSTTMGKWAGKKADKKRAKERKDPTSHNPFEKKFYRQQYGIKF